MPFGLWARLPMKIEKHQRVYEQYCQVPTLRQLATRATRWKPEVVICKKRDMLEAMFTLQKHKAVAVELSRPTDLMDFCIANKFFTRAISQKPFAKRVKDVEQQYLKLKKCHNARCLREGSHQSDKLTQFLDAPFYKTLPRLPLLLPLDEDHGLMSLEKMDRASPDLWPEQIPGVSEFATIKSPASNSSSPPKWLAELENDDIDLLQEFGSLTHSQLTEKVRGLQNLAYQLGLDEAREMTRGKFLSILQKTKPRS